MITRSSKPLTLIGRECNKTRIKELFDICNVLLLRVIMCHLYIVSNCKTFWFPLLCQFFKITTANFNVQSQSIYIICNKNILQIKFAQLCCSVNSKAQKILSRCDDWTQTSRSLTVWLCYAACCTAIGAMSMIGAHDVQHILQSVRLPPA